MHGNGSKYVYECYFYREQILFKLWLDVCNKTKLKQR